MLCDEDKDERTTTTVLIIASERGGRMANKGPSGLPFSLHIHELHPRMMVMDIKRKIRSSQSQGYRYAMSFNYSPKVINIDYIENSGKCKSGDHHQALTLYPVTLMEEQIALWQSI